MEKFISVQNLFVAFFLFIAALIGIRIIYSGNNDYLFLVWNLFLAWIPLAISYGFTKLKDGNKWKQIAIFFCWLIFFPNALYIVTDLMHLELITDIPKWFDTILLFSASVLGLMMAFVSLLRLEKYLGSFIKKKQVEFLIPIILFMGSFGVYLGRFLRWNSWDIIRNPFGLLVTIMQRFISPLSYTRTWGITCMLTALFYLLYLSAKKLSGYIFVQAT